MARGRRGRAAGARTCTATRVGRDGSPSVRKSRTRASSPQYPHASGADGGTARSGEATGASHSGHASVPDAMRVVRVSRRTSVHPEPPPTGSGSSGEDPSNPREMLTRRSLGAPAAQPAARAQAMQSTLSGIARRRAGSIGPPHASQAP